MSIKILYIMNTANKVNNFSFSSIKAAHELGMEFHIAGDWTGYENEDEIKADEENYGIKIHQIDFIRTPYKPGNYKAYKQVVELIRKEKIDIIHCNTPIGGVVGRLAGRKCHVKHVIYQAHGFHFYKGAPQINWLIYYNVEKTLARISDAVVTMNDEDFAAAKKFRLKKNGRAYKVHGVGIDLTQYGGFESCRDEKRRELGFSDDDIVIISVGELNENKNNSVIISAMAKLNNPHIHYILCGVGDCQESLENLARENGLENNVHFLGFRTDVNELYAASDIFTMPSFREGLSRSIMEAMASGLPCVVSKIRGNTELVQSGKGGFLCHPKNVSGFAKAFNILVSEPALVAKMRKYNLRRIREYSDDVVVKEMMEIYKEVLKK